MSDANRAADRSDSRSSGASWWNLLLVLPFIALLWVPFFNRIDPALFGIPFFYWYQFLWVILTSLIIIVVHVMTRGEMTRGHDQPTERGGAAP